MADEQTAGSSPAAVETPAPPATAVDAAIQSRDLTAYRAARLAERRGTPLDPPKIADSAPPAPADPAASTEVSEPPASEPGTPRKKNAESRIQELLAERAAERLRAERLERELADLRQGRSEQRPPESRPAPVAPDPQDPEPKIEDFEADPAKYPDPYTAHQRALARWEARQEIRQEKALERQRVEQETATKSLQQRDESFQQRIKAVSDTEPDFLEKLSDAVKYEITPSRFRRPDGSISVVDKPSALNALGDRFLESPVGPQLMRHFSDHPEEIRRFAAMPPVQFFMEIGALEKGFAQPAATQNPPPRTVTSAPEPPRVLGSKPAEPVNETDAAIKARDMEAYRAARLRERAANLR